MVTKTKRAKKTTTKKVRAKVTKPKVEKTEKVQEAQEAKVTNKAIQKTVINRELKWLYPDDCLDTLSRKAFRQKARNAIRKLERKVFKLMDEPQSREVKAEIKKLRSDITDERAKYLADPEAVI